MLHIVGFRGSRSGFRKIETPLPTSDSGARMNYGPVETILMGAHGVAGAGIVLAGTLALVSRKGSSFHRQCGKIFVLLLAVMALVIAASAFAPATHLISTLGMIFTALTCYLVLTSWATVTTPAASLGNFARIAPVLALSIASAAAFLGWQAQTGQLALDDGIPVSAYFVFAGVALLAACADISVVLRGGISGAQRLFRHLWRMCFALYFSVATIFTGPGSILFPDNIRGTWPLMLPENLILLVSLYFVFQIFRKRTIIQTA
jgi:uncharacterized membrane protein